VVLKYVWVVVEIFLPSHIFKSRAQYIASHGIGSIGNFADDYAALIVPTKSQFFYGWKGSIKHHLNFFMDGRV